MAIYTKESLEQLRTRIDLIEVLTPYVSLSRSGSSYKGLCPFHEEKTPSFVIQRGDMHYHCYGCGAHGDAIQFLMLHQRRSFGESVEYLADKFHVSLQRSENDRDKNQTNKTVLKEVLEYASRFFHFYLLHTQEGHLALSYLYNRGFDLDFIKNFSIGLAPQKSGLFTKMAYDKRIKKDFLKEVGLINKNSQDFFVDRIMIPIQDPFGSVIGFTARKYKQDTLGPKYINTPETPLFKKSRVLFGLNYSRKRITKERRALIVEGQFDALSLINAGFDFTVAGQGTAFGEDHVKALMRLGVNHVFLGLDSDRAGEEAAIKIGHLFQKEAIEVSVLNLPKDMDPDTFLKEEGPEEWEKLLLSNMDYLTFLVNKMSKGVDIKSPAGKNELVQKIVNRIKQWEHPLMVHESLRKLAKLTQTPESMIGLGKESPTNIYIKKTASLSHNSSIDPDLILETDLLRWLFLIGTQEEKLIDLAEKNLRPEHFHVSKCRRLFTHYINAYKEKKRIDLLSLAIDLEGIEEQIFLSEMLQKKVNRDKVYENFIETIEKILERHWMSQREEIKIMIQSGKFSEQEALELAKKFDEIRKQRPKVALEEN